jgi:hypothetical protein
MLVSNIFFNITNCPSCMVLSNFASLQSYSTGDSGNTAVTGETSVDQWHASYHEYAAEWGQDYVTFLVDGVVRDDRPSP